MHASPSYGRRPEATPVRLLIVDDSIVVRSILQSIVAPHPDLEVVATASSAERALAILDETAVDIVLLDLVLPGMDGLTALPEIVRRGRGARVLVVSASAGVGAEACVRALTLGAADTLEKPPAAGLDGAFATGLVARLRRIGAAPRAEARDPHGDDPRPHVVAAHPAPAGPIGCIAVGASTGGLMALSAFFRALPEEVPVPIVVTQHLPASFMPYFAAQMADIAGRPAEVATAGAPLRAGRLLIAPGSAHMRLRTYGGEVRVALDDTPAPSGCLPSVDPMFEALAAVYGAAGVAVVLTGMGRDGTLGARSVVEAGGEVVAQDRGTSVVWGMPGGVAAAGLAAAIDDPAALARRIGERLFAVRR